jgi:copper transport protein
MALLLAFCVLLLFPGSSSAHAVLVRSDPAQGAVLHVPPGQIHLWFSEAVDPQLSTAEVVTPTNQQAGPQQVHIPSGESSEVLVILQSHLTPGSYVVLWRTVSTDDGHVESGLFSFTVTLPDGTLPPHTHPPVGTTMTGTSSTTSLLDFPTLVSLLMVTLVELGAICLVGAAIFLLFVLEPVLEEYPAQHRLHHQVRERLLDRVLPLAVHVSLLAHVGVLVGEVLTLTSGKSATALTPTVLEHVVSGHFGLWWLVRMLLLGLTLLLLLILRLIRQRTGSSSRFLSWVMLSFGFLFLIALAMSSHAAAVTREKVTMAVLVDFFHLFAASLWVGGMLTIVLSAVPVLARSPLVERASSLVTALRYYSPWALAGVLLMAITGPLSAGFQLTSWQQLLTTAYGTVLLVKVLLVMGMLVLSAYHTLVLRPRIRVALRKYSSVTTRLETMQSQAEPDQISMRLAGQAKQREARLAQPTRRLLIILRIEPLLGVAVLLCVGLMNVLGGTLVPATSVPPVSKVSRATALPAQPRPLTLETFDHSFQVLLTMTSQHVGTNHVQVRIVDPHTGKAVSTVKVQLDMELLEQNMGGVVVALAGDGTGLFRGTADLAVSGTWRIIVQIQTPDDPYHFREAYTDTMISPS